MKVGDSIQATNPFLIAPFEGDATEADFRQYFTVGALRFLTGYEVLDSGDPSARVSIGYSGSARLVSIDGVLVPGVPEPASWAMMIAGFGLTGAALRHRRSPRVRFA